MADAQSCLFRPTVAASPSAGTAVLDKAESNSAYSIRSSARATSMGGSSRPSALAVFALMTSSNFERLLYRKISGLWPIDVGRAQRCASQQNSGAHVGLGSFASD
jgi:hypothetical protein